MILARLLKWCGGVLLVLAGWMLLTGARWQMVFNTVEATELARLGVDFSKVGEYSGTLHQVYSYGHDEGLELRFSPGFESYENAAALVKGLNGDVRIQNSSGSTVYQGSLRPRSLEQAEEADWERYWRGAVPLAMFKPLAAGDYTIAIQVTQPAPALAGRSQMVVGKHWLCGCEKMGASFALIGGGAAGAIGLALAVGGFSAARSARRAALYQQSRPHP